MEQCTICKRKFSTIDKLLNHITDEHGAENNKMIEITPELCTELGVTESQINVIKNTVAKGASDDELLYFLQASQAYGLSAIRKEIYFTKLGGKVTLMVSRDGALVLATKNPRFRGVHSGVVHEKDTFTLTTRSGDDGKLIQDIEHKIPSFGKRGNIVGAWCRVDMDGQSPIVVMVNWDDYYKNTSTWKQYGAAMIEKCAQNIGLKRVGEAPGLVSTAEMVDAKYPEEIQTIDITDETVIDVEITEIDEQTNTPSIETGRTDKT